MTEHATTGPHESQPLPLDTVSPQFTLRAILTGVVLASVLSCCNIYAGLRIGWGFNMAITAALLAYGFWAAVQAVTGGRRFGILENNINQTAAAAGASVSSSGLVAPIPALAMLTGQTLPWHWLSLWVFSVCLVGITVAIGLRRQMILVDKLPFATGIATAETLRELYARGSEAFRRVATLCSAALVAAGTFLLSAFNVTHRLTPGALTIKGVSAKSLTFGLDPTLLMYAVGGLVGFRACVSLVIGALLGWGLLAPQLIESRHIRLEIATPLAALPAGVVLPPEPQGYASYDDSKRQLVWKGVMTPEERDALLAGSENRFFQEAVEKLYVRSQRELSAPLTALPPGVQLHEGDAVRFDPIRRVLIARRGLDAATIDALKDRIPEDGRPRVALHPEGAERAWCDALDRLAAYFRYETTVPLRISTPLAKLPDGYRLPRELGGVLAYDPGRKALVAVGLLEQEDVDQLARHVEAFVAKEPAARAPADELRAAARRLLERRNQPLFLQVRTPDDRPHGVAYLKGSHLIQATGILTDDDRAALLAALPQSDPDYADYAATVRQLVAATAFNPAGPDFKSVVTWLLWPGATLMVVAALVSFGFSWRTVLNTFRRHKPAALAGEAGPAQPPADTGEVSRRWFLSSLVIALLLSVVLQVWFFGIAGWAAAIGVLLSFLLAIVAGRVSGETAITPVGAIGKVTQLTLGAISPGRVEPNLMAANVTGGAASQCAELLHDLKCGYLIGASPRQQVRAQIWGALAGSLAGSFWYILLVPHPREQLITDEWAAPAVATWKAVAELFAAGFGAIPRGTPTAMLIAGVLAVVLAVLEKKVPKRYRWLVLSPASLGLALVIQAYTSLTMFVGAAVILLLGKLFKTWTTRYIVTICAGIIAGESITGVGFALYKILMGI